MTSEHPARVARKVRRRWTTYIALAWLVLGIQAAVAAERYEMRSAVSPRATASRLLRTADPDESLDMALTLRLRHPHELTALIAAQQDPQSLQYHRWLTPEEFVAGFAPSPDEYTVVVDWLQREGFAVYPWSNRLRVDFTGTVANVERSFGVRMNHYSHRGRAPLANENPPRLPGSILENVDFVRLNTFPLAEPLVRVFSFSGLVNAMAPRDMYITYNMRKLLDAGMNGSGQTIAVVARSDFNASDVTSFEQQFGVPVHNPIKVFPSTNPGIGAPNGACQGIRNQRQLAACIQGELGEVLLDTEWATAMAPGASVLVDISGADIDASLMDIVTNHPDAKTITISFGMCEYLDRSDLTLFGPMYAQAATQGQTVLVATGDDGADDCQDGVQMQRSVNVLASDANVTAVGGTSLDPGFDAGGNATGYVSETVWNDADGASGGGVSILVSKPAYQRAPGVPTGGFRDLPDVSLLASPSNAGYAMVMEGGLAIAGGTSASAPSWAGIVALLNHALHTGGSGSVNATLYALGQKQYAENGPAVFHDVTQGDNSFDGVIGYGAGPGYDVATGLGTPDVGQLAQALGVKICTGDCNGDGTVSVDEILTGVNIALGTLLVSECGALDANEDGQVTVDELITSTAHALNGC